MAAALFCGAVAAAAEGEAHPEIKPFAVVSISSVNDLRKDAEHVVRLSAPEAQLPAALAFLDQADLFLEGVDLARAAGGVAWFTPDNEFYSLAFVPVTDAEKFFETLSKAGVALEKVDGGLRKGGAAYFKEAKGWVFVSPQEAALAVPLDPLKVLGTLPESYDLGASVRIDRIPGMFRQMATGFVQPLMQAASEADPDADEKLKEFQKILADENVRAVDQLLKEMERIDFGLGVDRAGGKLYMEYVAKPKAGSAMAKALLLARDAGGILPPPDFEGAPLALLERGRLGEDQKKIALKILGPSAEVIKAAVDKIGIPEPKDVEVAKAAIDAWFDATRRMTEDGAKEQVMLVERAGEGGKLYRALMGVRIPQGNLLAPTLEKILTHLADRSGEEVDWKKLPKTLGDGPVYRVAVDDALVHAVASIFQKPEDEVDAIQEHVEQVLFGTGEVLGESAELLFVFGKDQVWIGLGEGLFERIETLSKTPPPPVAPPGKAPPPSSRGEFSVADALKCVLPFISSDEGETAKQVEKLIPILQKSGDRVRIVVNIDDKATAVGRFDVSDGVLKCIQVLASGFEDL